MDVSEELRRAKAEIAKIANPKRLAAVRKSIEIHLGIMKLQFQLRGVRKPFSQDQVYWAERLASLEYIRSLKEEASNG